MKWICMDSCGADLTKGKEYESIGEKGNEHIYVRNDSNDIEWYSKLRFEPVKENTMKISKWEDLKWVKVGERYINWNLYGIEITDTHKCRINYLYITNYTKEELIGIIKVIGLDIEFEPEITITQTQFYYLKWVESLGDNVSIKLSMNNPPLVKWDNFAQYQGDAKMFPKLKIGMEYLVSDLLKMKVSG